MTVKIGDRVRVRLNIGTVVVADPPGDDGFYADKSVAVLFDYYAHNWNQGGGGGVHRFAPHELEVLDAVTALASLP